MKLLLSSLAVLSLFVAAPPLVHAAADVAVLDEVIFSTQEFFVGDTVRIYATIRNTGDMDVTGTVNFYLPGGQIGSGHEISMPKGGLKEEVFTDFVVPEGDFNIRIEIANIMPVDTNPTNNETLTTLLKPVADADRDRIADAQDNCPNTAGADQRDLDADGQGNICDNDIDGDGLTNAQEEAKGTDGWNADTDGDGVGDAVDTKPLGEPLVAPVTASETPEEKPETPETSIPEAEANNPTSSSQTSSSSSSTPSDSSGSSAASSSGDSGSVSGVSENVSSDATSESQQVPLSSTNSLFTYEEIRWGAYNFRVVGPTRDEGYRYEWDFGDGTTSSRREVTHAYAHSGTFMASLRVTDPEGVVEEDQVNIEVPFFDLQNRSVRMLLIFLVILLLIGLSAFYRLGQKPIENEIEPPAPKKPSRKRTTKSS